MGRLYWIIWVGRKCHHKCPHKRKAEDFSGGQVDKNLLARSISPSTWKDIPVEPSRRKTIMSTALAKPQVHGLLAKRLWFHIVGAFMVSLGFATFYKFVVAERKRRHMQISTEIMTPWKILRRRGRLVSFRVQSDLEYREFLWVEFHGSLSLSCVPELWNYDYLGWEIVSQ